MPRALIYKRENMKKQIGKVSREIETQRKNQEEMLEIKNTVTEIKNTLMDSSIDLIELKKEYLGLSI